MIKKREAPAFQFYVDDFLGGTYWMTNEQVGAVIRLLSYQWTKGGLPDEVSIWAKIIMERDMDEETYRKRFGDVMEKFFLDEDGMLRNTRMEKHRAEKNERRDELRKNSAKGGAVTKAKFDKIRGQKDLLKDGQKALVKGGQKGGQDSDNSEGLKASQKDSQNGATPTPSPTPTPYLNKNKKASNGKGSAKDVLDYINRVEEENETGVKYRATANRLNMISERISEVANDTEGVKQTYKRWSKKWRGTKYAQGLAPENFFGAEEKFLGYYEHRSQPLGTEQEKKTLQGEIDAIQAKFMNADKTFESEHRLPDGTLKPESAKRLRQLKSKLGN